MTTPTNSNIFQLCKFPQLLYTGSGSVFGISSKDIPRGEWKVLELPDKNVKVEDCSCDNAGTFSLVVSDKGTVYFGGMNKKGEAGEAGACFNDMIPYIIASVVP